MKATKFHPSEIILALVLGMCLVTGASAQLTLPYSGSYSGSSIAFKLTDSGWTNAGWFEITNPSNATTALVGITSGTGRGLYGLTLLGDNGVFGESRKSGGSGVWGVANIGAAATGVYGVSQNGRGVVGVSYNGEAGVKGRCNKTDGVGIWGIADTGTWAKGIYGSSASGTGVYGTSSTGYAGFFETSNLSNTNPSLVALTSGTNTAAFYARSYTGNAGYFHNSNASNSASTLYANNVGSGVAVEGYSSGSGTAVKGLSQGTGHAGVFQMDNSGSSAYALWATSIGSSPTVRVQKSGSGQAASIELFGPSNSDAALNVTHNGTGAAVYATTSGSGVNTSNAFHGVVSGTSGLAARLQTTNSANQNTAFYVTTNSQTAGAARIEIENASSGAVALYTNTAGTGYAAYLDGTVYVAGALTKAGGGFKIDHPLEPEAKYLYHSFVESPDMMNVYNGNVVLDANGEAAVRLPDWFEALNKDFRYQLTCIGGFAPVYIAQKVSNNQFTIAGGTSGLEVSWQVTGIRQDAWANTHRLPVEEDKPAAEQGTYLHPEDFGQPLALGVEFANRSKDR
jgi:hypothetical protein